MKRELVVSCVLALAVLAPGLAVAQDASVAGDASTSMSKPAHGEGEKQDVKDQATERDPHGGQDPHGGGAAGGGRGNMFEAPEDGSVDDPTIPAGSIAVHIADAEGRPLPRTEVTLGILYNSVAKGESRKRVVSMTDDTGRARFDKLDTGSGVAYRAMVLRDGATFSAPRARTISRQPCGSPPFSLRQCAMTGTCSPRLTVHDGDRDVAGSSQIGQNVSNEFGPAARTAKRSRSSSKVPG